MTKVYEIEESWTSLDQRLKAVGLVIEVGKEDWIEDIVSHLEAVHNRMKDLESAAMGTRTENQDRRIDIQEQVLKRLRRKLEILHLDLKRANSFHRYDIEECLALMQMLEGSLDAANKDKA